MSNVRKTNKIRYNFRFEAQKLLRISILGSRVASHVATIFKNLRLRGSKMELLIKKMCRWNIPDLIEYGELLGLVGLTSAVSFGDLCRHWPNLSGNIFETIIF